MRPSVVHCVRHLVDRYRSYLRTSYRFLDPNLRAQFEGHLAAVDVVVKGPYVTLSRDFETVAPLRDLVARGVVDADLLRAHWPFGERALYRHQVDALRAARENRSFVVTTGTGSGKTEAFLLPILDGVIRRKRQGVSGVQAILIYPMNALANDQLDRLRALLRGTGLDVSYALYTGDSDTAAQYLKEEPAETEVLRRQQIRSHPPDLVLTNFKQLEFMLVRREDRPLFTPSLRYLVLDELHSYRGALATEIACLIRRLRAHARPRDDLLCIGTSATVVGGSQGADALARFATLLYGAPIRAEEIIGEVLVPFPPAPREWEPPPPPGGGWPGADIDLADDGALVSVAERLTGKASPPDGAVADRIGAMLHGNAIVRGIEEIFAKPATVGEAAEQIRARFASRTGVPAEDLRREIESYLLVGSVGSDEQPPRLRPKLHLFFHGVYDVALCLNPSCRRLVPHGGTECPHCGSAARPAALCRTCGQDFVKVRFEREDDVLPVGTGDFYSDDRVAFFTPRIHELAETPEAGDETDREESAPRKEGRGRAREDRLEPVTLCTRCGRLLDGSDCPVCHQSGTPYLLHRGPLHTCPACGSTYTRGDIVTPLRTGTASTVSAITTHHLDHLRGADRKILVFADNRQDAAHQAGYTADKHRTLALRHVVADEARKAGARGIYLVELPQRIFDAYHRLGIIKGRPTRPEREHWLDAITMELANEFTRYTHLRVSLESLGLVGVEYEFLEDLDRDPAFQEAARTANLDLAAAVHLVRAILDVLRRNRAVALDFLQEYIDPNKKGRYRELEEEPYAVRFPDRDLGPKGFALGRPDSIRKARSSAILGFYQENPKAGQVTAVQRLVGRLAGGRAPAEAFIKAVVPILRRLEILVAVPHFPLPKADRVSSLHVLQIKPGIIRLAPAQSGFRCSACQTWRPYVLPTCPTPRCTQGTLQPVPLDRENYYVRLYTDREPGRLAVEEHSAQVPAEERPKRETAFKDGRLDALVCTPTLELGVNIGDLLTVALRNAPPTPANYTQRVGRAGRRLRIGFASTFCAGGAHDRHAFENPGWLVAGRFTPPRLRLDNPYVCHRHLRSFVLESLENELPKLMGDVLDDMRSPTRWDAGSLRKLTDEVATRRNDLVLALSALFAQDRALGRTSRYGEDECRAIVDGFAGQLTSAFERWWERVQQLKREHAEYSQIGSPRHDKKKAQAREAAYREITQDEERAYVLNYLSTQGVLPAYQFPVDTFSLDPGVVDTRTIYRPAALAIEEFAPGNFVYANGHKLRSIRALFAGGPGRDQAAPARSDAESSGRMRSFQFCGRCDGVSEETRNACPGCGGALDSPVDCVFVDAFEAEESIRIGSDEESRQRQYYVRHENLITRGDEECLLYPYSFAPVEYRRFGRILITNWGRADSKTGEGSRFRLCPDCGRHQPNDPQTAANSRSAAQWQEHHRRYCQGTPVPLVLGHEFTGDCLVLGVQSRQDEQTIGRSIQSPVMVTLAEALVAGGASLLELETGEVAAFPRRTPEGSLAGEIVFYETAPGGAGYVEEMARRLPEVAAAAYERLFGHDCVRGCYLCLKHYRNQPWHPFFDKGLVRDTLFTLSRLDPVTPVTATAGAAAGEMRRALDERMRELRAGPRCPGTPGPQSPIEAALLEALRRVPGLPLPTPQFEVRDPRTGNLVTVPDFAYPTERIAIFCDGFAYHGNANTLELDARKRNWLQSREGGRWAVLTYWGRAILRDPDVCAQEVARIYRERAGR